MTRLVKEALDYEPTGISMNTMQISAIPQRVDLVVYAGDGVALRLTAVNAETGDDLNLAGVIEAQVKAHRSDSEPIIVFTVNTDKATDGILDLSLSGTQTAALLALVTTDSSRFQGVWDVQWLADGEQPRTLVQGSLTCDLDVTRST
jgi:hypothetical protein